MTDDKPDLPASDEADTALWETGGWVHLPYAILEAFVDGRLDPIDEEIVRTHLEDCPHCRQDEATLRAAQAELDLRVVPGGGGDGRPLWRLLIPTAGLAAAAGAALAWVALPRQETIVLAPAATPRVAAAVAPTPTPERVPLRAENQRLAQAKTATPAPHVRVARATPLTSDLKIPEQGYLQTRIPRDRSDEALPSFLPRFPTAMRFLSDRPAFQWESVPGAAAYSVFVGDEDGNPFAEARSAGTYWKPDAPLPRGGTIVWQVKALDKTGKEIARTPEARFEILSENMVRRLAGVTDPLARVAALAEAGALADAEEALKGVETPLARKWRQQLQAARETARKPVP